FLDRLHGDRQLSRADICVAYFIINWFNPARGCAWPSLDALAERTDMNVRAVRRSIARLIAFGIIAIKNRGRRGHATEYVLCWSYSDSAVTETGNRVTALSERSDSAVRDRCTALTPHTLPPRSDSEGVVRASADAGVGPDGPPPRDVGSASDAAFEDFWKAYP